MVGRRTGGDAAGVAEQAASDSGLGADLRPLWVATAFASAGRAALSLGLVLIAFEREGAAFAGAIAACGFAGTLLSPLAGAAADRFDRVQLMRAAQAALCALATAIAWAATPGDPGPPAIAAVALSAGCGAAVRRAARVALSADIAGDARVA